MSMTRFSDFLAGAFEEQEMVIRRNVNLHFIRPCKVGAKDMLHAAAF